MIKDPLKYTCLFGGGAIRGISYCGALKVMEELNIRPNTYAGSSVGSIIAALVAVGYNAEEVKNIMMKVNFDLFKDIQFGIPSQFALSKGEVFLGWIRALIEKKYYGVRYKKGLNKAVRFKDIEKNLVIITTDISNFECKEFSKCETADFEIATAVRISCCMPGLMRPIEYNNSMLVDGDLQKSWPMWKLSENLCPPDERILEFRLEGNFQGTDYNPIEYLNAVYSCMTGMATSFITSIYGDCDKYDYIVINTGDINIVDFNQPIEKRKELVEIGYDATMSYFKEILPKKKSTILECYNHIYAKLNSAKICLTRRNVQNAKLAIFELFAELCDDMRIIDISDLKDLKEFKNYFCENIDYPALFGKTKLNNEQAVLNELETLIGNISVKIAELKQYLSID